MKEHVITQKIKVAIGYSLSRTPITLAILALAMVLQTQGYCADTHTADLEKVSNSIVDVFSQPWIRRTFLGFGFLGGAINSWKAGAITPFLVWAGLGMTFAFMKPMINLLSNFGG